MILITFHFLRLSYIVFVIKMCEATSISAKQGDNKHIECEQSNSPIQTKTNTLYDPFISKDDTSSIQVLEIPKKTCFDKKYAAKKVHVLPADTLSMITKHVQENQNKVSKQLQSSPTVAEMTSENIDTDFVSEFSFPDLDLDGNSNHESSEKEDHKGDKKRRNSNHKTCGKKRNKKKQKKMHQQLKDSETQDIRRHVSKTHPNYFIAVQISDPQIALVAKELQKHIQEASSANYSAAFIAPEKFHITLMVLHLADSEDVQRAINSLDKCVSRLQYIGLNVPLALDFEGLGQFGGGSVIYAEIKESKDKEALFQIADQVSKHMNEVELRSTDSRKWQPHLTLLKFKRHPQLLKQNLKKVEASLYQPYISKQFGTQTVCSLQLCQMDKKREDGYYFVNHESLFAPQCCESDDKK